MHSVLLVSIHFIHSVQNLGHKSPSQFLFDYNCSVYVTITVEAHGKCQCKLLPKVIEGNAAFTNCLAMLFLIVDWNADFKPGPYPVTEEQRLAAAKRYGVLPEEYKPYPDDGEYDDFG